MKRTLILLLPALGLALTGIEPVMTTDADGRTQVWYRINDQGRIINPEPLPAPAPPVTHGDTGVLWVDRNHRYGIAQSTAISADGRHVFANWYLNAERASYYRTLATEVPLWEAPGSYPWAYGGRQIGASEDGSVLALSSQTAAHKWSRNSPYPDWSYSYPQPGVAFARTSRQGNIVAAVAGGTLYVLNPRSGEILGTEPVSEPTRLQGLDISDDGEVIAVTLYDSCLVFDRSGRRAGIPIGTSNTGTQYAAALSGDGELLVTGDYYGMLKLYRWSGSTYVLRWSASVGTPWVAGVDISADGSTIACGTGYANGKLCVFDSSSSTPLMVYQNYGSSGAYVSSVALSADGSRVAAASWGDIAPSGTFRVFTVHNRSDTTPLVAITRDEEPGSLFACDISADGQFACAGGKAVHAQQMGNGGEVYAVIIGATPAVNAGFGAVASPGRYLQVGTAVDPTGTVRNYGDDPVAVPAHLVIRNGLDSIIYHDSTVTGQILPRGSASVTFRRWTPPAYDLYRCEFFTLLPGDEYPGDDSLGVAAKCFHDAKAEAVNPPGPEVTVNMTFAPKLLIRNNGSYADDMRCWMLITDSTGTLVYGDSATSRPVGPGETATVAFRVWNPGPVSAYSAAGVCRSIDDFCPENDTLNRPFRVTYEIMYDDGSADAYYWVGRRDNDKFYVRFSPTIPPPYSLRHGRIYVNLANTPFDYVMVCTGTETKPDTLNPLQVVTNVIAPVAPGWAEFDLDVTCPDSSSIWAVVHWPDNSPAIGIGADRNPPIDLRSYFSSNQDTFRLWTTHDWMVRLLQSPDVGLSGPDRTTPLSFRLGPARPNPFSGRTWLEYETPVKAELELEVFDRAGREVASLLRGAVEPGRYSLIWDGRELAPGVYFLRLRNSGTGSTRIRKACIAR
jgi:WD40 repeat protein